MGGEIPPLVTVNSVMDTQLEDKTTQDLDIKKPSRYQVILYNDEKTPMEFVIYVLQSVFKKNYEDAKKIMLLIHNEGKGICGVFPLDIAETKANQVVEELECQLILLLEQIQVE